MKKIYVFLFSLLFCGFTFAQDNAGGGKSKVVSSDYSRNAITVVLLNFDQDKYGEDLKKAMESLKIEDKFDNNQFGVNYIKANVDMRSGNCATTGILAAKQDTNRANKIKEIIASQKFGHSIVGKWYNMNDKGVVDLETIFKRGMYNATDADHKAASDGKRGVDADLKDAGYSLINNSYVIVLDFGNILTMDEFYDIQEKKKKALGAIASAAGGKVDLKQKRPKTGWITDIKAYLFKVDYNADVNQSFFDLFQEIPGDDQHWTIDKAKYEALSIPVKYIAQVYFPRTEGNEYKKPHILAPASPSSKEQLFVKMVNNGLTNTELMITRKVEAFRVKAPVMEAKKSFIFPNIKAKVGKKEGVHLDKRFFVWEKVEDKGKLVSKRRGVVRASNSITDNRTVTTGSTTPSKFYQISGKKLEDGMIIEERPDFGIGLFVGAGVPLANITQTTTTSGYWDNNTGFWVNGGTSTSEYAPALAIQGRLEYNVSPMIAKFTKKFLSEFRLFVEFRSLGEVTEDINGAKFSTPPQSNLFYGGGISKDIHLTRKIKLAPFAQYMIGSYNEIESAAQLGFGARLPINFNYWLAFVPSVTIFTDHGLTTTPTYSGLGGMYIDFGLRIGL
ncbi:MAG: hypothetical protein A2275_04415 [Bacteroidetes bacterium RIFOXYA12_FULL_35_11]|nr:MAG: hypothetical protein A2X01_07805 [Bacteroidetes bacterium GWF2_35_48]OFY75554.1 MAG: hypothetical protein A2275_04415 [Bacteroidetes bacterium RIFOXYA12_FULL_35_11]HBX49810.1 hypothetical protein [Bacteroidales bacterium]